MDLARSLAERMVYDYNRNPYGFSEEQGQQIARFAAAYGLDFKPESKGLKKFFYNLVNTGTLGALSLAMDAPRETGEEYGFGSTGGKIAGGLGGALGLISPIGIGGMVGRAGLRGAARLAPELAGIVKGSKGLEKAARWGATGAGIGGVANAIGDPLGAPSGAFYGGVGGAALSGIMPAINRFRNLRPESIEGGVRTGNQVGRANVKRSGQQELFDTPTVDGGMGAMGNLWAYAKARARSGLGRATNRTPEDIRNAAINLGKQGREGTKAAIQRMKSEVDSRRWFKGNPIDEREFHGYTVNFDNPYWY